MASDTVTEDIYAKFLPDDDPFDNHRRVGHCDEWGVHGTIDGKPATVYFLFTDKELKDYRYPKLPFSFSRVIDIEFVDADSSNT